MLLLLTGFLAQGGAETVESLHVGAALSGELVASDRAVSTARIDAAAVRGFPVRGRSYSLEVEAPTDVVVELESWHFDSHLVLRDGSGDVLAENDNGPFKRHARMEASLAPGVAYRVEACALYGEVGAFDLRVAKGPVDPPSPDEMLARTRAARSDALDAGDERAVGWTLMSEIHLCYDRGDFDRGAPLADELLALRDAVYGPDHPLTIGIVDEIAVALTLAGRPEEAVDLVREQLERREEIFGADHVDVGRSHAHLAMAYESLADFDRTVDHRLAAVEIFRAHESLRPDELVTQLAQLAFVEFETRELGAAKAHLREGRDVADRYLDPSHRYRSLLWATTALVAAEEGRHEDAVRAYERGIEVLVDWYGAKHPFTAQLRGDRAMHLLDLGDFAGARRDLEEALTIHVDFYGPDDVRTAVVRANLGHAYYRADNYERAEEHLTLALEALSEGRSEIHPLVAICASDLASVKEKRRDDRSEVIDLLRRAIEADTRALGSRHPRTTMRLVELARQLFDAGERDEADALLERALADAEKLSTGDAGVQSYAQLLRDVASMRWKQGDVESALRHREASLEIMTQIFGEASAATASDITRVTQMRLDLDRTSDAWELISRGSTERVARLERALAGQTEAERFRFLGHRRERLELLTGMAGEQGDEGLALAFTELVLWRGLLGRAQSVSVERAAARLDPEARAIVEELRSTQGQLSSALFGRGERTSSEEELVALRRRRDDLERRLATLESPTGGSRVTDLVELASFLPDATALLVFFEHRVWEPKNTGGGWSPPQMSAWLLRSDARPLHVELGPSAAVDLAVRDHLASIVGSDARVRGVGVRASSQPDDGPERLRDLVWDPIAPLLDGVDRVLVSPDGSLTTLPFGTIVLEHGRFLVEEKAFVSVSDVLRIGATASPASRETRGMLAVGAVDFGGGGDRWRALPATEGEVLAIADLDSGVEAKDALVLLGAEATESRIKEEMSARTVIHLATHGFFERPDRQSAWTNVGSAEVSETVRDVVGTHPGLLSGIVCAGANAGTTSGEDDGYLTAEEVTWLDLRGTDLVVLSACETAIGRPESGEGMMGLRRAFEVAGARTVVSSLWSVGDEATRALMLAFYRNLWVEGLRPGDALRAAQLERLGADRAAGGSGAPASWGAFVVSGDFR
ncbi:MAG: CHAT domain-containing tetratricopeptide repeat protein [Planctomycetota bacterium]